LVRGGGQERRRRAGTEAVAAIAGFGAAAEAAQRDLAGMARIGALRARLEAEVTKLAPDAVIIAAEAERVPNTSSIALPGTAAETLVIALDLAGIAISAGAACSSGKVGASHVLEAMGVAPGIARAAIRVSLGWSTTEADVAAFLEAWAHVAVRRRERAVA
jgi:cysteine desulfurase